MNTGVYQGIVRRLEDALGRSLLQLPCRHHVYELVCGAAAGEVYGDTVSPKEPLFLLLASCWDSIDKTLYTPFKVIS